MVHLQCHCLVARETMVLIDKKDAPEWYWPEPVLTLPSLAQQLREANVEAKPPRNSPVIALGKG